jgi:hypothetical protein
MNIIKQDVVCIWKPITLLKKKRYNFCFYKKQNNNDLFEQMKAIQLALEWILGLIHIKETEQ